MPADQDIKFNKLSGQEKWTCWKEQKGKWLCKHCKVELTDGPQRARPFDGCEVCCSACDGILTRRTGGGQNDPFNWILCSQ